jgi:hypothetical protein
MNWNPDYVVMTPFLWLFIILLYGWGRANREVGEEEGREEGIRTEKDKFFMFVCAVLWDRENQEAQFKVCAVECKSPRSCVAADQERHVIKNPGIL